MDKWSLFLVSIGSIFIMISPTENGAIQHLILGLGLIGVGVFKLVKNKKKR